MMRAISAGMMALAAAGAACAQAQEARPAFEAAFVKVNTTGANGSSSNGTKGQLVMDNQTMRRLIERAYRVEPFQVSGPEWIDSARFDIMAKYPPDTKSEDRPVMLRTLLEDRFKLAVHRESKELPGYALVAAKSGFKLKPVEPGPDGMKSYGGNGALTLKATKVSMADLADFLARLMGATVVDRTGLDGVYDFELHWTSDDPNGTGASAEAALFAAIQESLGSLGLRMQAQKAPVEVVVVDHVERVPTENWP